MTNEEIKAAAHEAALKQYYSPHGSNCGLFDIATRWFADGAKYYRDNYTEQCAPKFKTLEEWGWVNRNGYPYVDTPLARYRVWFSSFGDFYWAYFPQDELDNSALGPNLCDSIEQGKKLSQSHYSELCKKLLRE